MSSKRVLLVLDALYIGGTETHVLALAKELIKNEVLVVIAARKTGSLVESFEELNCPIYHIEFPNTLNLDKEKETELIKVIGDIIEREKISLVHYHQAPSGYLAGKSAKNKGIATVLTVHGTYYPYDEIRKLIELSDSIICVSPPICNYIQSLGVDKPYLIPNGIDLEYHSLISSREEIRDVLKIPKNALVVLYASRITWEKASVCSAFLRACKDLKLNPIPTLHVIIVGDGNKLEDIRQLSKSIEIMCNNSFIHIVGEQKNMHAYYSAADCVVGTGRVALEAMASGKPVIAVGNHGYFGTVRKENIDDAWNHYFGDHGSISPCNKHILSQDLEKLFSDQNELKHIGIKLRKLVEKKFNVHKITSKTIKIYKETIKAEVRN